MCSGKVETSSGNVEMSSGIVERLFRLLLRTQGC
jgi:hypothetical protein